MNTAYKDLKKLKNIIRRDSTPTNKTSKINLTIYYKTKMPRSFIIKNLCFPFSSLLQETNVVYAYTCNVGACERRNSTYVGMKTFTLSTKLTFFLQDGVIKRQIASQNTIPLDKC